MEHEKAIFVRGNYIYMYKDVWEAVSETLVCISEPGNANDQYAVAVENNEIVIRFFMFVLYF